MWLLALVVMISQTLAATHFHAAQSNDSTTEVKIDFSNGLYVQQLQKFLHEYDSSSPQPEEHAVDCELCVFTATSQLLSVSALITEIDIHESPAELRASVITFPSTLTSLPRAPPLKLSIV